MNLPTKAWQSISYKVLFFRETSRETWKLPIGEQKSAPRVHSGTKVKTCRRFHKNEPKKTFFHLPEISSKRVFQHWQKACSSSRWTPVPDPTLALGFQSWFSRPTSALAPTRESGFQSWFSRPTPALAPTRELGFQSWFQPPDFGSGTDSEARFSEMIPATDSGSGSDPGARFSGLISVADFGTKEASFFHFKNPGKNGEKLPPYLLANWQGIYIYPCQFANLWMWLFFCRKQCFSGHFGRFFATITLIWFLARKQPFFFPQITAFRPWSTIIFYL